MSIRFARGSSNLYLVICMRGKQTNCKRTLNALEFMEDLIIIIIFHCQFKWIFILPLLSFVVTKKLIHCLVNLQLSLWTNILSTKCEIKLYMYKSPLKSFFSWWSLHCLFLNKDFFSHLLVISWSLKLIKI